ncbi:hypothetical protein J4N39_10100 [Vibrio sp. SCSIO 43136]|nr:hypothetical protein J4N39_10100 [Vibrio sp. SCSIO 43136]
MLGGGLYFGVYAGTELELPECAVEELVETRVKFIFDYAILSELTIEELELRIAKDLEYANLTLSNSCIPMRRVSDGYDFVNFANSTPGNMASAHYELSQHFPQLMDRTFEELDQYVVLTLSRENSYFDIETKIAETWVDLLPNFVVSDISAAEMVLEHEFGHLAWARHDLSTAKSQLEASELDSYQDITTVQGQDKLKPYAHGATCGDAGTIMSYQAKVLPIYSSPKITYQGEVCGDAMTADNARLLTEYARTLKAKLTVN